MVNRVAKMGVFVLIVGLLSACQGSPTFLQPSSPVSSAESNLFSVVFYMGLAVLLLVWIVLGYNIIRYRSRGETGEPRQKYGNWRLEVTWTVIPIVLVLVLFVLTIRTLTAVAIPAAKMDDVNVTVIGHRWWWEFDYPDLGIKTANELHVPVGANVHLTMQSADVIHSFWVPQLSGKVDVIPGQVNNLWFSVDQPNTFDGMCSEFCGLNHANMRILVVAEQPDQYNAWVLNQQQPPYQPASDLEKQGAQIVTKGLCANCHTLGDNEAKNPIGPNLTHLMSRKRFAGAILDLNPENLHAWLKDPQAMKPGNDMVVNLTDSDINALMAYLTKLK